jgi:uncharacterized C2H2 Zn-finger protein
MFYQLVNRAPELFPCAAADCGRVFKTRKALSTHNNITHKIDQRYVCKVCAKPTGNMARLKYVRE